MGYYAPSPYEQPEPPCCPECGGYMVARGSNFTPYWECDNPECDNAPEKYKTVECDVCSTEHHYTVVCPYCTNSEEGKQYA